MSEHRDKPWEILNPHDALVEAAKLNQDALAHVEEGSQCMGAWTAQVALSLSTYALAMYRREGS